MSDPSRRDESGARTNPIRTNVSHSARIWNYWLGGKDHYEVDEEVGDQILGFVPELPRSAIADRRFLARSVRYLAEEAGIRPDDVIVVMNGVTMEILSTDAEGRLVLSDGLVYTSRLGVGEMIDQVLRVNWGHIIDPAWAVNQVWCALLGVAPPEGPSARASALALTTMVLLLVVVIERKLRPVEVVS